jgi:ubiquinone/menaquinone biosynthesis C-methylase UbiE
MNHPPDSPAPKRVVEQGYDQVAREYARLEDAAGWPRMRWLQKLLDRLQPGASVLDLGCGSGEPADVEIAKAHRVTGVDISETQITLARQNVPTGTFIHGDAGSVAFPAGSFDAVVSFYTLEHIPRAEHAALLGRMAHWLRPGGLLLISMEAADYDDVTGTWLGVPMFLSCFDPETTQRMVAEAGFELLESVIETQIEQHSEVPYLWVLAQKR